MAAHPESWSQKIWKLHKFGKNLLSPLSRRIKFNIKLYYIQISLKRKRVGCVWLQPILNGVTAENSVFTTVALDLDFLQFRTMSDEQFRNSDDLFTGINFRQYNANIEFLYLKIVLARNYFHVHTYVWKWQNLYIQISEWYGMYIRY